MAATKSIYLWSSIDRIGNSVMTFGANIVLALLLDPADFGLLAMVAIFSSIAYNLSSCGMSDGLIHKPNPTEDDYSTVMVFNGVAGLFFAVLFIALSRPIANFFNQPPLVEIMWAIGICFFFQTLSFVQETRMRKKLDVKKIAMVRLSATFCAVSLGIWLAVAGYGYWGLVSCQIFLSFFLFVFYVAISRWFPRLRFSRTSFREMFGYGVNLMVAFIFNQISRNVSTFAIGRSAASSAGIFSQAQKMEDVPFTLTDSIFTWPFFAVAANEEAHDKRRTLCHDMLQWLSLLNVTMGMLLILVSAPVFHFLFGEKWDASIPVFRILVIFGIATTMKYFFQTVMKTYGMTPQIRNISIAEILLQISLLIIALPYGLEWIAASQCGALMLTLIVYIYYFIKIFKTSLSTFFKISLSPLVIPAIACVITGIGYHYVWNPSLLPLMSALATTAVFVALLIICWEMFPHPIYKKYRNMFLTRFFKK